MPVIFREKPVIDNMRKRIPKDVYLTDPELARATVYWLRNNTELRTSEWEQVLDPGAGNGVWGQAVLYVFSGTWRPTSMPRITGVEQRRVKKPVGYTKWFPGKNYLNWPTTVMFNVILGNPPFKLAEEFVRKSMNILMPGGLICFLLPTEFAHTQGRSRGLFQEFPPHHIVSLAERPQFRGPRGESLGDANTDNYILGVWVNADDGLNETHWHSWSWKNVKA